jgi:cell division protein FtsI/penicillin-binding protein 2
MHATRICSVLRRIGILVVVCSCYICAAALPSPQLDSALRALFKGRKGSAVVLDIPSGRILAAYDIDRASRRLVRPGSAIKPFVLATLIDRGRLRDDPGVHCDRFLAIAGRKLNCGHPQNGLPLHAVEALAYSCNTYFTQMAARLTGPELQQGLLRWGLTSQTGLVSNEVQGRIALSAAHGQLQLQGIGEENILVTPLGLLAGYRRLALERREGGDASRSHAAVFAGLEAATDYGMSRLAQPRDAQLSGKPLRVAGKTGTSIASEGTWTHGWFAGFAPADHPQVVVVVFLEHGTGPTDAAPIARKIFELWAAEAHQ